ncbi:MAG: PQQ-dependent sugar dehydrogenase [Bacteroidota bacterium]
MKKLHPLKNLLFCFSLLFISNHLFSQAICTNAIDIGTISGNFTPVSGDLYNANSTNITGGGCGNRADIWYKFTLPAGSTGAIITVVRKPTFNQTLADNNTYIELFNGGTCGTATGANSRGCQNISIPRKHTGLTAGGTYYFRVNTTVNVTSQAATDYGLNVYVVADNDNCANTPSVLVPGTSLDGTLWGATNSGIAPSSCSSTADDDVWYKFTAPFTYASLSLTNIGSDFASAGPRMELFSGTCGALVSKGCSGNSNVINTTSLVAGTSYLVRIYSANANPQGGSNANWGYRISLTPSSKVVVGSGRMKEVFHQQIISAPNILNDPWEITYGPDNNLWVTESKGYRLYRINPTTGVRDTVLNVSQGSTFFTAPADVAFNAQFDISVHNPQGGFAGMAFHPKFLDPVTPKNYVYVSYVYSYDSASIHNGNCKFFKNRLVRFTYNTGTNKLESPVSLCDTLPGGNDHNSQRIYIAPVGDSSFLFYAQGDLGGGQLDCYARKQKAQVLNSYEGKILRFNLEPDNDLGPSLLNKWIPNNNPFNATLGVQSAVWVTGIRNNQGFAYDSDSSILYGSSHGPYSDDEINIIEPGRNYGHPLVIGFKGDNNYANSSAGTPRNSPASTCPVIGNENTNATNIGASYKDPLFTAYPSSPSFPSIYTDIWNQTSTPNNGIWPSEAWSGLDLYTNKVIPGWKKSLVAASLKWGRLVRLKLGVTGRATAPTNTVADTVSYFGSQNRFRDLAFDPNGKDIYVIMDKSTTTSGPSSLFPVVPSCKGCLQKYTFLGYADNGGKSSIDTSINVTNGPVNICNPGTSVTIDATNNTLWVPITGPDGNIMAEINAMGQDMGVVNSSFYKNSGAIRIKTGVHYLDRNMTISPAVTTYSNDVKVRLYISRAEFNALVADGTIGTIGQLKVLKNNDACGSTVLTPTTAFTPSNSGVDLVHGDSAYVLQIATKTFSSFYFAVSNFTLPLELLTFRGSLQSDATQLVWETANENNTSHFIVERSIDNASFTSIGTVAAVATVLPISGMAMQIMMSIRFLQLWCITG